MEKVTARAVGWPVTLLVLLAILAVGTTSVILSHEGAPVATFWPAAGITVALFCFSPHRRWPLLWLLVVGLSVVANAAGGREIPAAVLYGVGNATEAVVAGYVLRQATDRPRLEGQDDFLRLLLASVVGGATAAVFIGAAPLLGWSDGAVLATFGSIVASHGAAVLVLVPVALTFGQERRRGRGAELAVQCAALGLTTLLVFGPEQHLPLTFVPLLFPVWAALRFDVRVVSWQLAFLGLAVSLLSSRESGPFGVPSLLDDIGAQAAGSLTQAYMLVTALLSLPLAIAVQQRAALLRRISADERLFRRNFTESLSGMLFLSSDGDRLRVVDLNHAAVAMLGGRRERLMGCALDEVLRHDELLGVSRRLAEGSLDGWRGQADLGAVTERRHGRVNLALSLLSGGRHPVFSAQLLDVTAEYDARRRLESAEKLTSATLDTTACIILLTDLEGRIVRVNAATTDLTGYAADDLVGRPVWDTPLAATSPADLQALLLWPNRSGAPVVREGDAVASSGERMRIVWNSNVVRDELGFATYVVITGVDVTAERASAGLVTHLMQAAISTALIGIGSDGRITVANTGARQLLGFEEQELVGSPFHRILDHAELLERTSATDADQALALLLAEIQVTGEGGAGDWTWVSRTGRRSIVSMSLSAAEDSSAVNVGFLCVGRDVTEQRHSQELLVTALEKEREAVDRLRALDEAKNEFVSTVSHELRTPVTSIVGYTEMLLDGSIVEPRPEQQSMLGTIARNGQRLIVLCNDLLVLSGLDGGNTRWERETHDLAATVHASEESLKPLLTGRRLEVAFEVVPHPVLVTGDPVQLERVLMNLLSNAVKFTADGGSVSCRLGADRTHAVLEVRDTGIGIPVAEQAGLFTKFFRSSITQKLAIQGTGLGLSIVDAIVKAHDGEIAVASDPGRGTTVTVRLPLAAR
ncbi:PAS domain S-box protein [Nocardioides ferulae]|uniref:PAS domain S-box protein n=1 Tax=Nocardioides ferulae TaxID=2340821 RepID=UPI0013DDFD07|nr:PAS domain S-box protein [Nocardioides ferulae]